MVHSIHLRRKPPFSVLLLTGMTAAAMLGAPSAANAVTGPWQENEQSRVRLVSPWAEAPRAGDLRLGLEFEIRPGWHVYWKNSGDAGFPPVFDLSPTPQVRDWELLWPAPERYELRGGLVAFGYENHVIYPVRVRLDEEALSGGVGFSPDTLDLAAELDYLVCEVDCIPYSYPLALKQPLAAPGAEPVRGPEAEEIERWWRRLPRSLDEGGPPGVTTRGALDLEDPEDPRLVVEIEGVAAVREEPSPQIFLEAHELFDTGRPGWEPTEDGLRFTVPLSFREVPGEVPSETEMAWTVTGLRPSRSAGDGGSGGTFAVEARRTVLAAGSRKDTREETEEPATTSSTSSDASGPSLLAAFVAGLLLALTPPLLVVFGLRLLASGRLAAPGIRRGALASVVGALAGFGGVALAARGQSLATWGAQLQDSVLVTLLALANLALAFAAWGLLGLSTSAESGRPERDHVRPEIPGLAAGLLTAFLALGWSVPGMSIEPAAMVTAGLGASVPYLLVAAAPGLALGFSRIAGRYRLKEGLGFLALVGLVWLLYLLTALVTPEGLALIELMLLVLGLLAWGRTVVERRILSWLLTLLLLAGAFYVLYLAHLSRVATGLLLQ